MQSSTSRLGLAIVLIVVIGWIANQWLDALKENDRDRE